MKLLLILVVAIATNYKIVYAEDGYCHSDVLTACKPGGTPDLANCHAKYGEINAVEFDLQSFVNKHITHSFQYLLLSSHFKNYEKSREGFTKLFKSLSDKTWNDAIDLIKYITKRGGRMDFGSFRQDDALVQSAVRNEEQYELYELESLAKALDIQKSMAVEANRIHLVANRDAEVMSHIENTYVHKLRDSIRELAGHSNDLKNLIASNKQNSLHVYLFDEYLQKLY
ncbi:UNVERIFIED_CONTAM: hypothetical protein PYX00_002271 [Menopon gallinae]|uniref:Ferritin n=1 Tax=Menopon gallinae TaxID=328185 RepID=A0AAW2IHJ1_9NEOP